ncbi:hypothetical protein KEM48_014531 [Puccinia striiformis f. sp. tritici PST-130]|nr:hypothetical protein KEM48_014531 [Puccinia striiformis f. sp. tritici PST-130]
MMQEDIRPIEPLNLDKINAIADRLMSLANELLESKLSRASSSSGTMAPSEEVSGIRIGVSEHLNPFTRGVFERNPKDKREEPDAIDPHELMIKRLKFELSERKRFEAEKKELLQKKLKLSKENDEKKSKLMNWKNN